MSFEKFISTGAITMNKERPDLWPTLSDAKNELGRWFHSILIDAVKDGDMRSTRSLETGGFGLSRDFSESLDTPEWNLYHKVVTFSSNDDPDDTYKIFDWIKLKGIK